MHFSRLIFPLLSAALLCLPACATSQSSSEAANNKTASSAGAQAEPAGNSKKTDMAEEEISIAGPLGPLAGTALLAGAPDAPMVLILPGSGPTDRNGNNPLGVSDAPYSMLANALAGQGISSARIDKRGMFASAKAIANPNQVTIADYAQDARDWASFLKEKYHRKCIWLMGHSEGGLIALKAAQSGQDLYCGLILVAAPGRPLDVIIAEQLHANPANAIIMDDAKKALASLKQGKKVDVSSMHPGLQGLFPPAVQGFLIDIFSYDPARLIANVEMPVLILQGKEDIQVKASDAQALKASQPAATLVMLDNVNHVLKHVPAGDQAANQASYANPDLPVDADVVKSMADFIWRQGKPAAQ